MLSVAHLEGAVSMPPLEVLVAGLSRVVLVVAVVVARQRLQLALLAAVVVVDKVEAVTVEGQPVLALPVREQQESMISTD